VALQNYLALGSICIARIIHQPEKSAREDTFGTRMILSMTVSQDDHDSKTPSSDCPGTG
jgi:hypothetical protein